MSSDPGWSRDLPVPPEDNRDLPVPSEANRDREVPAPGNPSSTTLWIGVGVVFALMALAWTAMFFFTSKYRAESVPVEKREAR